MTDSSAIKKFEGFATIGRAFDFVLGNLPHMILTAVPTLFIISLVGFLMNFFFLETLLSEVERLFVSLESGDIPGILSSYSQIFSSPMLGIAMLVSAVLGGMFAVRWHRSALYGTDDEKTGLGIEFSSSLLSYIWRSLLISFIAILLPLIGTFVAFFIIGGIAVSVPVLGILIGIPTLILALVLPWYLYARFSLALPASALEIYDFGLRRSWNATKGHAWGIIGLNIVMFLIVAVASTVINAFVGLAMIPFVGMTDLAAMFNPNAPFSVVLDALRRDIWVQSVSGFLVLPVLYALFTSMYSYIYFQLGQPPQWVEDKTISMDKS